MNVQRGPSGREVLVEAAAEFGLGLLALATLAGATVVFDAVWSRHRGIAIGAGVAFLALAAYGIVLHFRGRRLRGVLAYVAVGAGLLLLSWVVVGLMGCC